MNCFRFLALLSACFITLVALPARADLKVVTTVPDLAAITRAVGGEHVDVTPLSLPTQDPHFVDARPHLALALNKADLLIAIGLQLEVGWLPTLQESARNARILRGSSGYLEVAPFVRLLETPTTPVDRSQGDVHPGGNPHFLYDPRAGILVARAIAARLAELDAANADTYRANADKLAAEVEKARAGWEKRLAKLKGTPVIAFHRTTAYLEDWLGFQTVAFLEPKPGIPPNPAHVAQVLKQGRQQKVHLVLQEAYYANTTSKLVAQMLPANLVHLQGGTDFRGGKTYLQYLEDMVTRLETALAVKEG